MPGRGLAAHLSLHVPICAGTVRLLVKRKRNQALKPLMNPRKKVDLKLIIVGALGVGKTSLLHQYVHKTFFEEYQTTLGASILSKIIILDDTTLKLQIWDTGGQERFRSMVSTFYKGSDGCILAFDVTDPESFEALDIWRDDVLAKIIPMEQSYPMVVLGNKIDLEDRKVSQEVVHGWCKEKDMPYFEVSAKNDINVVQAFEVLASRALLRATRTKAFLALQDRPCARMFLTASPAASSPVTTPRE